MNELLPEPVTPMTAIMTSGPGIFADVRVADGIGQGQPELGNPPLGIRGLGIRLLWPTVLYFM